MAKDESEVNHRDQRDQPDNKQNDFWPARNGSQALDCTGANPPRQRPAESSGRENKQERCAKTLGHRDRPYEFTPPCASRDSVRDYRLDEIRADLVHARELSA